jgi:hypothetical protein
MAMPGRLTRSGGAIAALAFAALLTSACEDGPHQIYSPSPEGAEGTWNDGKGGNVSDKTEASFTARFGGTSKQEICTAEERKLKWEQRFRMDIQPPTKVGGLDLAGGPDWPGLPFATAESRNELCQANALGADGDIVFVSWGDNNEIIAEYNVNTQKIDFVRMLQGYTGKVKAKSDPKSRFSPNGQQREYVFQIGAPVLRDGQTFRLDWGTPALIAEQGTELFHALMYTFAPELPRNETNCVAAGQCLARPVDEGEAVFGARGIGFYIHVPSITAPGTGPSTPDYFYMWPVKLLPFSAAEMFLKLDQEGPIATANELGDKKKNCKLFMGQKYKDFIDTCVAVSNDPTLNKKTEAKLLGNMRHTDENFIFSVEGVNQDFSSEKLFTPAFLSEIVHDDWRPEPDDQATEFILDVRATGSLKNEIDPRPGTSASSIFATAAIYREYVRLVQQELHKMMPSNLPRHDVGSPECLMPDTANPPASFDPKTWRPAAGCTGFEGAITPAKKDTGNPKIDKLSLGVGARAWFGYVTVLKPGDPKIAFCDDPTEMLGSGLETNPGLFKNPNGFSHCSVASLWDGSFQRVLEVLGNGNVANLPTEVRDRKWYFKIWALAYTKYLLNAHRFPTDLNKPPANVTYDEPELDHLLFDDLGAENEKFEYIDRRFVDAQNEPIKFEYEVLILSGNQRDSRFHKRMTRPERVMYRALAQDKTLPPGKENSVLFTNMVGSTVLKNNWYAATEDKNAYYCATHVDEDCLAVSLSNKAPTDSAGNILKDERGQPLLSRYPGAFGETVFTLGTTHIKVQDPDARLRKIRSAVVEVPNFANPFDPSSANGGNMQVLVDWREKQPTIGISVPFNGIRDKFVEANEMDFSGSSVTLHLDYLDVPGPNNTKKQRLVGASSNDYLGDLFLCRDPRTGDLLRVEQYESMATVIDWIEKHPGTRDACGLIVRYSPYNNYPHQLIAKEAGMYVIVKQGSGYGRVSTVVAYDRSIE